MFLKSVLFFTAATLVNEVTAQGNTYGICGGSVNGYSQKWGYVVSPGYGGTWGWCQYCSMQITLPNPQSEYILLQVTDWWFNWWSWDDRLRISVNTGGGWQYVGDYYAFNGGNINGIRAVGNVLFEWWSTCWNWSPFSGSPPPTGHWQITWTYQKYVFGCQLYPQPYIYPNTTKYGILQSPFFPDHYPVNVDCTTIIDVDQAVDTVEFIPLMFNFRQGDTLYFYVGDVQLNNWVRYDAWTVSHSPWTFRIAGADVKVQFTSDNIASNNGYRFYWRVFTKERYSIYKPESLFGFWPMTAAHRGNDIIQGCNAAVYPTSGSITPTYGPFGHMATGLWFNNAYLNMTSSLCAASTLINTSFTISAFAQSSVKTALVELIRDSNATPGLQMWTNYASSGQVFANPTISGVPPVQGNAPILTRWIQMSLTHDNQGSNYILWSDNTKVYAGTGGVNGIPSSSIGFLFGYRDSRQGFGGIAQIGRFTCLSMYSSALSQADLAQLKITCQNFHQQYEIYQGQSLVGWWPLNSISSNGITRDVSGNGLHGTIASMPDVTLAAGPTGAANTAYSFIDAQNSYVTFPYTTNLKSFTINLYIKTSDSGYHGLLEFIYPGRGLCFMQYNDASQLHVNPNVAINNAGKVVTVGLSGAWRFVSTTYEAASGNISLWLNGAVVLTNNIGTNYPLGVNSNGFWLGRGADGARFPGQMSCLSIYKVALTASQIAKVMAACNNGFNQPPLVDVLAFWPMTSLTTTSTQTLDISGNEFHGNIMSSCVTSSTGPFGVANTALTVGTNASCYINFPYSGLNLYQGSFTIACYMRLLTTSSGPILEYLGGANAPGAPFGLHIWANQNSIFFNFFGCMFTTNGGTITWNQWAFVAGVYDSTSQTVFIWRDGAVIGVWGCTANPTSTFGLNVGLRQADQTRGYMQIACLSIYQVALDNVGIPRLISMCQSYLMDQALRDQSRVPEVNCNFDGGFCGWTQAYDDDFDWTLEYDSTPTGLPNIFTTGPRFGKSAERADALDRYALINSALAGWGNYNARLLSPFIAAGWHCFTMWYYMSGSNVNTLKGSLVVAGVQVFYKSGYQGKQWNFLAVSVFMPTSDAIAIDGWSGNSNQYSDIAIDDIRVTNGKCMASTPCPRPWIEYGRKCYMNFMNHVGPRSDALWFCRDNLNARLVLPEDQTELLFVQSIIGGSTVYADATLSGSIWSNSIGYPLNYLPWAANATTGQNYLTVTSSGFLASTVGTNYGILCETTKMEAQHLGFNCSFDNKHLCGWWNINSDRANPTYGAPSLDTDVWADGFSLPWQNEDNENGPDWDWSKGNLRGYYAMIADSESTSSCSDLFSDLYSPLMKATGRPQCLRFRMYHPPSAAKFTVTLWTVTTSDTVITYPAVAIIGGGSTLWRTVELEIKPGDDYMIMLRMYLSCNVNGQGYGSQAVDEIMLFDGTCSIPLFNAQNVSSMNSNRPQPQNAQDGCDALGDSNFYDCNTEQFQWRDLPLDHNNFGCQSATQSYVKQFRQTGPQSDYTGEGNYLNGDFTNGGSLTGVIRWSGPPVGRGQKCFIFHYFMHGYDVGELRLVDGYGRYLFSRQNTQGPSWKEHRILFSNYTPTSVIFEASSGQYDGSKHFQKYESIQLDDIFTRNGTDLCLGYMDCDFDRSSYLSDCGWQQNDTDDADWIRNLGETPAGNGNSGPTADHTTGLGHYLYFDATNLRQEARARIHMPPLAAGTFCLTFYYYMWGQAVGSLRLFYVRQSNLQFSNGFFPPYAEQTLWQRNGSQGNAWIRAMVPIQLSYPQILTFEAMAGSADSGDIAIDDVVLLTGGCTTDRSLNCSFERGDTCAWYNDPTDQQNFITNKGKTTGAPMTGPEGDSTGTYAGGYYIYMQGATSNPGDTARLISPVLPQGTVCFQASYNMRGRQLGQLNVYRNSDLVYRLRGGSTGYEWRRITLTINSNSSFAIKIEAVRGVSSLNDIAIDDISVTDGRCIGASAPITMPTNMQQYKMQPGYALVNHNMTLTPNASISIADCIAQCQNVAGCLSVNYNLTTSACQYNNATADMDPYFLVQANDTTHAWAVSPFKQLDMGLSNICSLDSPFCNFTQNCNQKLLNNSMLACQCQQPGMSCYMPQDCSVAFSNGYRSSGVYLIQAAVGLAPVQTWCDMDVANQKGYTVLMNRYNGGTRFNNRYLTEYQQFFGSPSGEFWIGLDFMSIMTNQYRYGFVIESTILNSTNSPVVGLSQPFVVGNSGVHYKINLQNADLMTGAMNSTYFSSMDADFSGTNNCPSKNGFAGWWYKTCGSGLLTGVYRPGEIFNNNPPMAMYINGVATGLSSARLKILRI